MYQGTSWFHETTGNLGHWNWKYLSNHLRRFRVINGFKVLLHRSVVVLFLVQIITILPKDDILLRGTKSSLLSKVDSEKV